MEPPLDPILPSPRVLRVDGEGPRLPARLAATSTLPSPRLAAALERTDVSGVGIGPHRGDAADAGPPVRIARAASSGLAPGGYRLSVAPGAIEVEGADEEGAFRGLTTLARLVADARAGSGRLPALEVEDAPAFAHRAVSLDVNRDKVYRLETLFELVDLMAELKLNQLQLYLEHAFAYRGHEVVWRDASPYTPDDVRALDDYCHARFVELVPNQNSLAHLHRWLVHDRYRGLAECPDGVEHPFSFERQPFSLCPTDPRSLELVASLFDELLPNFRSRTLHVGLDEPMDVGQGRSRAACLERGVGRVFLEYLQSIHALAAERGCAMQFWSDWILQYPELIEELPADSIAMVWGYEADHDFARPLELLGRRLERHYVCPGTSSWNSITGRTANALANLEAASRAGVRAGSEGYLVADWGDNGHWQPLPVSLPGLVKAAAEAWNPDAGASRDDVARTLDRVRFADPTGLTARVWMDLGEAHAESGARTLNGSAPFFLLHFCADPLPHHRLEDLTAEGLERTLAALDRALAPLAAARPACGDADQVTAEARWAAELAAAGCRLGLLRLAGDPAAPLDALPRAEREELAGALDALARTHRTLWLRRNRPGGLADSVARIERVRDLLTAGPGASPAP